MDRREAIRLLATAASLPLIPADMFGLLRSARSAASNCGALQTLNASQNATGIRLAEIILPETDTPGATAAHVNEFIDLILTEWYSDEDQSRFLRGLEAMDAECQKLFGKRFTECDEKQQVQIVTALDQDMIAAATRKAESELDQPAHTKGRFFRMMKELTLTGYFTSEVGAKQALHFQLIPGHYRGCVPISPAAPGK
jgi:hypothetical protein